MMLLTNAALVCLGAAAGFGMAGGMFALILSLKVLPRFAQVTHTSSHITLYEDCMLLGGGLGNLYYILDIPSLPLGNAVACFSGLFSGIFVGCVALAIAEIINVFPIMFRRINLQKGLGLLVLSISLGKLLGLLVQLGMDWTK